MVCWTPTKQTFTAHSPIETAGQNGVKAYTLASASDEAKAIREEVSIRPPCLFRPAAKKWLHPPVYICAQLRDMTPP